MKPLCFVLMPFGKKKDAQDRLIDFDSIYHDFIKIAIEQSGLEPIRADEEMVGGSVIKPMLERLILCEFAIADLTTLNPNVFYELGIRHAIRSKTTISIFAFDSVLPFDLRVERMVAYKLDENGEMTNSEAAIKKLVKWIEHTRQNPADDSPVFQLIDGFHVEHTLTHDKTDVFGKQAKNNNNIKDELFIARNESKESVIAIWESLMPIGEKSVGVVLDLFLSLRAVDAHEEMIDLYKEMDPPLQKTKLVQEQYGFALNRVGKWKRAEKVLVGLIKKYGFDPETNGILGRVYKDLYKKNRIIKPEKADKYLKRSIKCYRAGFDADWRDAYPGVNLITLAEIAGFQDIIDYYLPVVKFAAMQQLEKANYWDLATIAELRVVEKDIPLALEILEEAITFIPDEEDWMLETTLNNLMLIRDARKKRGAPFEELDQLIDRFKL